MPASVDLSVDLSVDRPPCWVPLAVDLASPDLASQVTACARLAHVSSALCRVRSFSPGAQNNANPSAAAPKASTATVITNSSTPSPRPRPP